MNFSQAFIERPIATSLLMGAIALFGMVAYRSLPVSDLPNVDFPTLLITASLPGASPETMGSSVATPLENQFSNIAGLESMTSTNSLGSTQITLEFSLNKTLDSAAVDVQAAITQAARLLPQGMPTPPTFTKVNPADQPILYLAVTSKTMPLWTLDEYAETRIAQRISMVSGVAQVQVLGAQKYAVHVQVDPHPLATHQTGLNEVQTALQGWNVNLPTGTITGPQRAFTLQASGQLMSASQYRSLWWPTATARRCGWMNSGASSTAWRTIRPPRGLPRPKARSAPSFLAFSASPAPTPLKLPIPSSNLLPTFRAEIPPSVNIDVLYDRSDTIRESYKDVQFTMLLTLGLVIAVIFFFLRNFSATVIPSLALPFSIIGTFAVMYLLHYSLDNLSMMALILSVGFVVDDAIVMLENIFRHIEMGEKPLDGGARRFARNRLHHRVDDPFAGRRVHSRAFHGRNSRPSLPRIRRHHLRGDSHFRRGFRHSHAHALQPLSAFVMAKKDTAGSICRPKVFLRACSASMTVPCNSCCAIAALTMTASAAVLAATVFMFVNIPKGFIPDQDTDQIYAVTEAAQGTSYYQMAEYQQAIAEIFRAGQKRRRAYVDRRRDFRLNARWPQLRRNRGSSQAARRAHRGRERNHPEPAPQA